ncbi:MAG: AbrB/MazE/SpoVT family DNA-binding domain-containing protein [Pseudomonadota bacterium]|nr:AbrB/MazE/SpoVT family DNA-binding domain-containing protein [Pseudomonadota bacterium]
MTTLSVSAKGQVTLKKELLQYLGLQAGERIRVEKLPGGMLALQAAEPLGSFADLKGKLKGRGQRAKLSVDEMNAVIAEAAAGKTP